MSQQLRLKSTFMPPTCNRSVSTFANVKRDVGQYIKGKHRYSRNLYQKERRAIQELSKDTSKIVKPADKGGGIVVMDYTQYKSEVKEALDKQIEVKTSEFLIMNNPRRPCLYLLPKIHKSLWLIPQGGPLFQLQVLSSIRFTAVWSKSSVAFLDVLVQYEAGKFKTSIYRKPTNRNTILHAASFHPPSLIKALPYSQMTRVKRITSEPLKLENSLESMVDRFCERGYGEEILTQAITKAPMLAYKRGRNLKDMLVKANNKAHYSIPHFLQNLKPGNYKCFNCSICNRLQRFQIKQIITCQSTYVVYTLVCGLFYIGKTIQKLKKDRFIKHKSVIEIEQIMAAAILARIIDNSYSSIENFSIHFR
ncbi:hypothetical protein XELAEV_18005577mg [Xenopus laevis]|uniref:Helix-turn-helix domain-containing protein n=1 Tax=Xenopus laevis TaxID=8355 RepID=A0A974I3G9_XENLA|nr:hypothetical protein XELAEV_18005577mg [Xenopus laevis]